MIALFSCPVASVAIDKISNANMIPSHLYINFSFFFPWKPLVSLYLKAWMARWAIYFAESLWRHMFSFNSVKSSWIDDIFLSYVCSLLSIWNSYQSELILYHFLSFSYYKKTHSFLFYYERIPWVYSLPNWITRILSGNKRHIQKDNWRQFNEGTKYLQRYSQCGRTSKGWDIPTDQQQCKATAIPEPDRAGRGSEVVGLWRAVAHKAGPSDKKIGRASCRERVCLYV